MTNGITISTSDKPVQSNDVILLPQDLPDGAQFTITYTIQSQGSSEIPQIATQTIKVLTPTWEMGKHYVYTLDFSNGLGKDYGAVDIAVKAMKTSVSVTDWVSKDEGVSLGKK